jgi:hypothetical protein
MAMTAKQLADVLFKQYASVVTGAVLNCGLLRKTQGAYNPTTGRYADVTSYYSGKCIIDAFMSTPDIFPGFVAGPQDVLFYIKGLSIRLQENDILYVDSYSPSIQYQVVKVSYPLGGHEFVIAVARR